MIYTPKRNLPGFTPHRDFGSLFRVERFQRKWFRPGYLIVSLTLALLAMTLTLLWTPPAPVTDATYPDPCTLTAVVCPGEIDPFPPTVSDTILGVARSAGFNGQQLITLAACESSLNPNADTNPPYLGLFQWNPKYIPGGAGCALSTECSTQQTILALLRGEDWRWPSC